MNRGYRWVPRTLASLACCCSRSKPAAGTAKPAAGTAKRKAPDKSQPGSSKKRKKPAPKVPSKPKRTVDPKALEAAIAAVEAAHGPPRAIVEGRIPSESLKALGFQVTPVPDYASVMGASRCNTSQYIQFVHCASKLDTELVFACSGAAGFDEEGVGFGQEGVGFGQEGVGGPQGRKAVNACCILPVF